MTTVTLLSAATATATGPALMFTSPLAPINGTVTITVAGQPTGYGGVVSLFTGADFADSKHPTQPIIITAPGVYTLTAVNSAGIRAALMGGASSPVTVTAAF